MKKLLTAILIGIVSATVFAAGESAQFNVYDYKASIKRIEYVMTTKKANKVQHLLESYKVVSDTIQGYVVIPACIKCYEGGVAEALDGMEGSQGWFIRKGDKLWSKSYNKNHVAHDSNVFIAVGKFGAQIEGEMDTPIEGSKNKYAWMKLGYALGVDDNIIDINNFVKNFSDNLDYAFLGASNMDAGYVVNTGFGTIKNSKQDPTYDPCEGIQEYDACDRVESITGTLCGGPTVDAIDEKDPEYMGLCNKTPIWDLCSDNQITKAVICGTWTLKYNAKLTRSYAEKQEEAIYEALKVKVAEEEVYESRAN